MNATCVHDPFPSPFTDETLENVKGREIYSFTNGFFGYHQFKIIEEDMHKTTFVIEWGSFTYTVMPFGLKNAPTIFSRIVVATFREFIHKFLEVYLNDWTVFSLLKQHIQLLWLMLDRCRQLQISLNIKKCIFCTPFGILLDHIVCKDGLLVDPAKVVIIVDSPAPTWVHELRETLGHTGYYRKFMHNYSMISPPLEMLLKKELHFKWNEECGESI